MREKLWIVGLVLGLVLVWSAGFLWVRGDLTGSDDDTLPAAATASSSADPSASPTRSPRTPSQSPTPTPSPTPSVPVPTIDIVPDELGPVDINPDVARPRPRLLPPVAEFNVASFNVLGSSHTGRGGHSPGMASGTQRMGGVLQLLAANDISVVGLQEFQPNQRAAFNGRAAGWTAWPGLTMGRRAGENSVAWREDTWQVVETHTVPIPYFNGRIRPMPYVLLQHRETGLKAWFSTFHNPANVHGPAQRYRNEATRRQIGLFNRLETTGYPQFVTGDMNERAEYPCKVTRGTPLVPAQGGSCPPAPPVGIDWLLGSPKVQYSSYRSDRGPLVRRTSDHPLLVVHARVDSIDYPKAVTPGE